MKKSLKIQGGGNPGSGRMFASDMKRTTGESLLSSDGTYNANDKRELIDIIRKMTELAMNGVDVRTESREEVEQELRDHSRMVKAAFDSTEELSALGDLISQTVQRAQSRDGFMRRFLNMQPLIDGQQPRVRLNLKNGSAVVATGPNTVPRVLFRSQEYYPAEFHINARPFVAELDIKRSADDILEETYSNTIEAFMVQEDREWKRLADKVRGNANENINIAGRFQSEHCAQLMELITRWNLPARYLLVSSSIVQDFLAGVANWQTEVYDPVTKHEINRTGNLGEIFGLEIITDASRHQNHKVLESSDVYVIGQPNDHGQYTDRGGIQSESITGADEGVPGRGWMMSEILSMMVVNDRTVAHATVNR